MHACLVQSCPTTNLMDFSLSGKYTSKDVILKSELGKDKIK